MQYYSKLKQSQESKCIQAYMKTHFHILGEGKLTHRFAACILLHFISRTFRVSCLHTDVAMFLLTRTVGPVPILQIETHHKMLIYVETEQRYSGKPQCRICSLSQRIIQEINVNSRFDQKSADPTVTHFWDCWISHSKSTDKIMSNAVLEKLSTRFCSQTASVDSYSSTTLGEVPRLDWCLAPEFRWFHGLFILPCTEHQEVVLKEERACLRKLPHSREYHRITDHRTDY